MMCFVNDIVPFEPFDSAIDDWLIFLQFDKVFVDKPRNLEYEGLKDNTLKSKFMNEIDYKDALVTIILNAYRH